MLIHRFPPPYMAAKPALSFGRAAPVPPKRGEDRKSAMEYTQDVVNFIIQTRPPNQHSHGWTEYDAKQYAQELYDLKQLAFTAVLQATKEEHTQIINLLETEIQKLNPQTTLGEYKRAVLGIFKQELQI